MHAYILSEHCWLGVDRTLCLALSLLVVRH